MNGRDTPLLVLQQNVRDAYVCGAPGVAVSGIVWVVAGIVLWQWGTVPGFGALFFGGMLIQPLAVVISRLLGAIKPVGANDLERMALESIAILFVGLLIAYRVIEVAPTLVFATVALAIGARYMLFRTLYDVSLYWALGGLLMAVGTGGMLGYLKADAVPFVVGAVELVFAGVLFARARQSRA